MITDIAEGERVSARNSRGYSTLDMMQTGSPLPPALGHQVLDFIFSIQQLNSRSEIEQRLARELKTLGIAYFLIQEWKPSVRNGKRITGVIHPQAMQHYEEAHCRETDPIILAAENSQAPVIWSHILASRGLSRLQKQVYIELSRDYGLRDGMCVMLTAPGHKMALANCAGFAPKFGLHSRTQAQAMLLFTYNRLTHLEQLQHGMDSKISQREADCLSWVAQGKTDWEIGEILHISDNTAHWYVERAKRKLGVSTRIQAVVTAIQFGIIHV